MTLHILENQCHFHQFQEIDNKAFVSQKNNNKAFNKGFSFFSPISFFFLFFGYKILHASGFLDMLFCVVPTFSTLS